MRRTNDLAALGLLGAAIALLMTVLLPRASWAAPADRVEWGLHRVALERNTVIVRSTWSLDRPSEHPVPLAVPLPAGAELTGAEPVTDVQGAIVALDLPDHGGELRVEIRMPWRQIEQTQSLPIPVPSGASVHRVVFDPKISFSPDPALGLIAQVGHYAPAELDVIDRHRFDARTDGDLRNVGAYYVRGQDLEPVGAMKGEITLQRQRMGRAALVAGGVFGLVVLVMLFAHRRLNRHVKHEQAEAYLAQEFEALEADDSPAPPSGSPPTAPTVGT